MDILIILVAAIVILASRGEASGCGQCDGHPTRDDLWLPPSDQTGRFSECSPPYDYCENDDQ
jgi:hypothetical protein